MKKLLMVLSIATIGFGLTGCGDNDDNNDNVTPPSTGAGTGDENGETPTGERMFSCTRPGDLNSTSFTLSEDGKTIVLTQAPGNPITFNRADQPDDSDSDPASLIEYHRNGTLSPSEIKISGPIVVNNSNTGALEIGNNAYACTVAQ